MQFSKDAWISFLNDRNPREKKMLLIMALAVLICVDYWIVVTPILFVSQKTLPELSALQQELQTLRDDWKNRTLIDKNWNELKLKMQTFEQGLISQDEIPALLQNLSRQAKETGLKITSLKPTEHVLARDNDSGVSIPIEVHALAGAHECGFFLERLENDKTIFNIKELRITANPDDAKRHLVEMSIEVYQKK